ncbi:unnamed protein product [Gongylonema pulchrum]|uniref:BZIP domain-containing protein n=1 Tax=Gongylonema pulchrum TaxID=637853 RepID=A0A183EWH9_9BILA|nr:unnamed protein product [Gongylonema pulchrum]
MPVPANQLPVPSKILPDDGNRRCELSEEDESGRPLSKTQKRRIRRERAKIATEIKSRQNPEPKESKKIATGSAETERSKLPNLFDAVPVWESRPATKALNVPRLADTVPAFDPEPKRRQIPRLADAPSTWDELGLKVAALISARKQVPAETHQASRGSSIGGSSLSDNTSRILPVKSGNVSTAAAQYGEQSTAAYQVSKPLAYDPSRPSYGLPNAANQQQLTSFSSDLASSLRSDVFWF